ncbi:hypothetical conserved protein (plasmid) [Rhizobium etli CFN 42]|uniref:Hypothetical conserved protein n=1 Tax=Rhizobium etli (strain ATCC 51251 / DSM 11541 / JCM 21823 / NBRC 15573 / CFN 42) TaxID=347834 RepID=Q2K2N6_RHIEC|nr:hypothetical conserved protein [Rhizobium etli CFN 42]
MVAIVVFLLPFRAAPIAASMAVARIGDDRPAPPGSPLRLRNGVARRAGMKWRAAKRNFVAARGMAAPPPGEESFAWPLREDDRGEAVLRSDMPHRAREGRAWLSRQGNMSMAATPRLPAGSLRRGIRRPVHMSKSNVRASPNKGVALAALRAIVVLANRRLEDLCVSSQSRLSSKSSRPGSSSRPTGKPRSGASWTLRLILTRSPR